MTDPISAKFEEFDRRLKRLEEYVDIHDVRAVVVSMVAHGERLKRMDED